MNASKLSLTAELLLLAIDPAKGGLYPRRRRRFRKALAATYLADRDGGRHWPWVAAWARREALAELEQNGILEQPRLFRPPSLLERGVATRRFNHLCRCIRDNEPPQLRDRELLLLLAWTGVLAKRLSTGERRLAARRLRKLGADPHQLARIPQAASIAAVACADLWSDSLAGLGGLGGGGAGGGGGIGGGDSGGGGCGGGGDGGC